LPAPQTPRYRRSMLGSVNIRGTSAAGNDDRPGAQSHVAAARPDEI
jgi:hypothetical protein